MKVKIRNIGIIRDAELQLDGITVVTGENDSGKSSIGKALFSLVYGIQSYRNNILDDAKEYIRNDFYQLMKTESEILNENFEDIYFSNDEESPFIGTFSYEDVEHELANIEKKINISKYAELHEQVKNLREKMKNVKSADFRAMVRKNTIYRVFFSEFAKKISNVFTKEKGILELVEEDATLLGVDIVDNKIEKIYGKSSLDNEAQELFSEVSLINTPLIIDSLSANHVYFRTILNHRMDILMKLRVVSKTFTNIIESAEQDEMKKTIELELSKVLKRNIIHSRSSLYENNGKKFSFSSLASGMKSYVIIKLLLDNGYLKKNSLLIIDEPEVHLHPAWQLSFAELLVLLNKTLGVKLLLATHSPYFLQAVEVFSQKYNLQENTHFYLSKREAKGTILNNIDNNLDETYKLMAEPIKILQSLQDSMED